MGARGHDIRRIPVNRYLAIRVRSTIRLQTSACSVSLGSQPRLSSGTALQPPARFSPLKRPTVPPAASMKGHRWHPIAPESHERSEMASERPLLIGDQGLS